jgi:TatD DNase family protein
MESKPRDSGLRLIDSHVHLDGMEALDLSIERARKVGVVAIVAVGMGGSSNRRILEIAERHPGFVYPALGLHPRALVGVGEEELAAELKFIEDNISKIVALGEIGLDYDKRVVQTTPKLWQQDVLSRLLELAKEYNKPVAVHALYAWKDTFELVKQSGVTQAIFHWYAGFVNVLDSIIKSGFLISATPAAEYHAEHRRAIRKTPIESLLLETDAPVFYGRDPKYQSEPADIIRSLKAVSAIKGMTEEAVAEQTTRTTCRFFGLDK